jgi:hypothetical protein
METAEMEVAIEEGTIMETAEMEVTMVNINSEALRRPPVMDCGRMRALADEVERPTLGYDFRMSAWCARLKRYRHDPVIYEYAYQAREHPCETACCMAGLAVLMFGDEKAVLDATAPIARALLGLTTRQANLLFLNRAGFVSHLSGPHSGITRAEAARAIRLMVFLYENRHKNPDSYIFFGGEPDQLPPPVPRRQVDSSVEREERELQPA